MKIVVFIISIVLFFVLDYNAYYYGFGFGVFNQKLPKEYGVLFSGSDLGNQGIIIEDKEMMGTYLIRPQSTIILSQPKGEIQVSRIIGYYYRRSEFIVVVEDSLKRKINVEIKLNPVNRKWKYEFDFYEINQVNKKLKYVNLDYPLQYFKTLKFIRNSLLFLVIAFSFYLIIFWMKKR
jgi:hypothetical protein